MTESVPKLRILTIRDQRVLLDADLARLYGVETRSLNQAVKRNLDRFPEEFAFPLTRDEILRISQTVTSLRDIKFSRNVQAFTEHGALQAANVLNSPQAVQSHEDMEIKLFTIGFTQKSAREFFTALKDAGVKRVVDVRLNNNSQQAAITYANEADVLNMALFGQTAKQWRDANPKLEGNMREYATIEQLLVLANIEGMNAEFIHMDLPQGERLKRLNQIAIRQMQTLTATSHLRQLEPPKGGKE